MPFLSYERRALTLCCWFSFFSVAESEDITCEIFLWYTSTLHNDIFCQLICKVLAHKHFGTFSLNYFKSSSVRKYIHFGVSKNTDFQGEKGVEYIAKIKLQLLKWLFCQTQNGINFLLLMSIKKCQSLKKSGILILSNLTLLQVANCFCTVN